MQSQVHSSLISADNALLVQSNRHPDGWGVAYYQAGAPHVIKSVSTALSDHLFRHVSGIVTSETVVAHLRNATQGQLNILDTHPFQYGTWVFAHNGNIKNFADIREKLIQTIPPILRRFILGEGDSEVIFYMLLGKMAQRFELDRVGYPLEDLAAAVKETVDEIISLAGELCEDDKGPSHENYLSFVISNGKVMLAHQGGKHLYYSTYKNRCGERDVCPHFRPECEKEVESGFVSHLVFSSEPLQGDNIWFPMHHREMIGVDWRMQMTKFSHE